MPTKQRKTEVHRLAISGFPERAAYQQTATSLEDHMPTLLD